MSPQKLAYSNILSFPTGMDKVLPHFGPNFEVSSHPPIVGPLGPWETYRLTNEGYSAPAEGHGIIAKHVLSTAALTNSNYDSRIVISGPQ